MWYCGCVLGTARAQQPPEHQKRGLREKHRRPGGVEVKFLFFLRAELLRQHYHQAGHYRERIGETHTVDQAKEGNRPGARWQLEAALAVSPRARDEAYFKYAQPSPLGLKVVPGPSAGGAPCTWDTLCSVSAVRGGHKRGIGRVCTRNARRPLGRAFR